MGADSLGMLFIKYAKGIMDFSFSFLPLHKEQFLFSVGGNERVKPRMGLIILLPAIHMRIDRIFEKNADVGDANVKAIWLCARAQNSLPMYSQKKKGFSYIVVLYH